jgi:hypothetical protein
LDITTIKFIYKYIKYPSLNISDSADKDGTFINRIITGEETWVFSVQSTTEAMLDQLEITIIAKKEETATGQVKRQGNA